MKIDFSKKTILVLVVVLVAVVAALGFLLTKVFKSDDPGAPSGYSAVFMSNGDVYFGKLSLFPWPKLTNIWLLQRGVDAQGQAQFGITKFTSAFWGPVDKMYLNPKEVLFWSDLRKDSEAAKAFTNPSSINQAPAQGQLPAGGFQGPSGPPPSGN